MLMPVGATFAQEQDAETCDTMLEASVGLGLRAEGFDTTNACDLTLAQLAKITGLLGQSGMGARLQIQAVLDEVKK